MGHTRRPSAGEATIDLYYLGDQQPSRAATFATEARLFLELALPTTLLQIGFTLSPLLTASYVGLKFGPTYLSAFTLGNLTGNLCTFSLLAGLFSAADTLSPQSFAKGNYKEVGLIAMRGVFASIVLLVPINVLLVWYMEDVLVAVGQDPEAAYFAAQWYKVFVAALPFFVVYNSTWKMLSAQHVMRPLIYVSVFCSVIVLPIALEILTRTHGFLGSAAAYVVFQASQAILLILYLVWKHPHAEGTWPGLGCWREALELKPMLEYLSLGAGGILAQSEWVYWEALGLIVGRMGVVPLSVHTIPNQVIMALCQPPFSFGTALAIRMGHTMTSSVMDTKRIAAATVALSTVLFGVVSVIAYVKADSIIGVFTVDPDVIELANEIWWKVCTFNFNIAIFGVLCGIATGLGMQWTLGAVNVFFLWVFGIPLTIYYALAEGGGLDATWTWINAPYVCMNICLLVLYLTVDWDRASRKADDSVSTGTTMEEVESQTGKTLGENERLLNATSKADYGVANLQ